VDVLSSLILVRPGDLHRSHRFYSDVLGLAIYRSSALRTIPGLCFSLARACPGSPGAGPTLPGVR
jgi:hypothetical protein